MRQSTVRLADTPVRLADLRFPIARPIIARTRLVYIHLDNLLHFSKVDRDGRVDGFVASYLPDSLVILFLRRGELVNAVTLSETGRAVTPIVEACDAIRGEAERGELLFADAPSEQLAWMYASCASPATSRFVDPRRPDQFFPALRHEGFSGVLELISNGRVNYFMFEGGEFQRGYFADRAPETPVPAYVKALFAPGPDGAVPQLTAGVFAGQEDVPPQASPEMLETYHQLYWAIARVADRETAGQAAKHAQRYRDLLSNVHRPLAAIGRPQDGVTGPAVVASPEQLTFALSDWTLQFLEQVEVFAPGVASTILRDATRSHRYVLQRAGFYDRLPWSVVW
jgi:hypothetical protein